MNARTLMTFGVAILTAAACADGREEGATPANDEAWAEGVEAWRARHETDYRRDWVSIAGLHFLDEGTFRVGSANTSDIVLAASAPATIGQLIVSEGRIRYQPEPGVPVLQNGHLVTGSLVLKEPGVPAADEITVGDVRLVIHESGGRLALRVRDPDGRLAQEFAGFTWFPIDPQYRVTARFLGDATPRTVPVLNTFGDEDFYPTDGVLEFTLQGETLRLRPFTTRPNRFYIVFRDASSGDETYATARFLYADLRDDGTAVLDFNEAYNPPCAFNPYTTCPIPLRENRLPVKILAGEKAYAGGLPKPTS